MHIKFHVLQIYLGLQVDNTAKSWMKKIEIFHSEIWHWMWLSIVLKNHFVNSAPSFIGGRPQGALKDLTEFDDFQPNDAITLHMWGDIKVMLADYKGDLKDSNEVNVLQPHHFANARSHEATGGGLPRSLKDLNKVDLLQLNNVIVQRQGVVKILFKGYLGALNNLNKGDVLKPNDALSLQMQDYALRSSIQGLPEIQPT